MSQRKGLDLLDFPAILCYNIHMKNSAEIAELKAEIEQLKQQNQWLLEQLKLAGHRQFGPSSEKMPPDQLSLFNEAEQEMKLGVPEPEIEKVRTYCRRKAGSVGTDRLPEDLPIELIEHDIPVAQRACPCCGEEIVRHRLRNP